MLGQEVGDWSLRSDFGFLHQMHSKLQNCNLSRFLFAFSAKISNQVSSTVQ